jgi:hypothetical protein
MDWSMILETLALPSLILLGITSLLILISQDWRINLLALSFQYVGVFILVLQDWSFSTASTILIAGWMAVSILGTALTNLPVLPNKPKEQGETAEESHLYLGSVQTSSGRMVSFLATFLVWLIVFTYSSRIASLFTKISFSQAAAGLLLICMGILQLGFSSRLLKTIIGLLTFFSGFEILYAPLEASALVAGLLALVNLGLAMVGAYLLVAEGIKEEI